MKKYLVEMSTWNEREPDNGIWQSEAFPDLTEAETEEEAISLCIDYIMEGLDWSTVDCDPESIERKSNRIEYRNSNGDRCGYSFRATAVE